MNYLKNYESLSPTDYGNVLAREQFMDYQIKALWSGIGRICGPAFTVQLAPGDNLMLHAAIYQATPGSVIVIDACDNDYAVAGGNVCAVARERGIKGFIIDGVIRDLGDIRAMKFPVFARGVCPVPGGKAVFSPLNATINCGGVRVSADDIIVADEEGIAVIPADNAAEIFDKAKSKANQESELSLDSWREAHQAKIEQALNNLTLKK